MKKQKQPKESNRSVIAVAGFSGIITVAGFMYQFTEVYDYTGDILDAIGACAVPVGIGIILFGLSVIMELLQKSIRIQEKHLAITTMIYKQLLASAKEKETKQDVIQ